MAQGSAQYFHLLTRVYDFHVGFEAPLTDEEAMLLAFRRAIQGLATVAPNPAVGCVILDADGRLLADGHHTRAGGPHAEIHALMRLFDRESFADGGEIWSLDGLDLSVLKGARLFVTLEPCAHRGRTPSCARTLAQLPLQEVVYGVPDPNPLVAGRGAQILNEAGVPARCWLDLLKPEKQGRWHLALTELIEIFRAHILEKRCFVSVKFATSLDGAMALTDGSSQWITGAESREFGLYLRGLHDAVAVGVETVLRDNPALTMRHPEQNGKVGHLVVLDPHGKILLHPDLKIFKAHPPERLHVITQLNLSGVTLPFRHYAFPPGQVLDLPAVLRGLYDQGIRSVYVEGGAFTVSEFLRQGCADRLWHFEAPMIIGHGRHWSQNLAIPSLDKALLVKDLNNLSLGPDRLSTYRVPPVKIEMN